MVIASLGNFLHDEYIGGVVVDNQGDVLLPARQHSPIIGSHHLQHLQGPVQADLVLEHLGQVDGAQVLYHAALADLFGVGHKVGQDVDDRLQGHHHVLVAVLADLYDDLLPVVAVGAGLQLLLVEPVDYCAAQGVHFHSLQGLLDSLVLQVYLQGVLQVDYGVLNGVRELLVRLRFHLQDLQHGDEQQRVRLLAG